MHLHEKLEQLFARAFSEIIKSKSEVGLDSLESYNKSIKHLNTSILEDTDFDEIWLLDILRKKADDYEGDPSSENWQRISTLVSVIYQRGRCLDELAGILGAHLTERSRFDPECLVDWLETLGYPAVIRDFLLKNAHHENHYLIEKLLREVAYHKLEIGDVVLSLLDHHSGFVRDAAVDYMKSVGASQHHESLCRMIENEPDEDCRIILKGIHVVLSWGLSEEAKNLADIYLQRIANYRKEYQEQEDVAVFKRELESVRNLR